MKWNLEKNGFSLSQKVTNWCVFDEEYTLSNNKVYYRKFKYSIVFRLVR